ncbi:sensor histidine kinase [Longispora fulva]|uniref:histidine kinase n=1 Tax=Longispora fulva TaxID=619741 RepID=A0A8J7KJ26_9ACTN|nr:sensor histidine kinase [Longispora fulva]MBG6135036.1 signal transduction histidine kinase [Longispora fulva]
MRRLRPRPPRMLRPPSWRVRVLPVVVAAAQIVGVRMIGHNADVLDARGYALLTASGLVLYLGRVHVGLALTGTLAATGGYLALGYPWGPVAIGCLVALFLTVLTGHRQWAKAAAATSLVGFVAISTVVDRQPAPTVGRTLGVAAWLVGVLMLAEFVRVRRMHFTEVARTRAEEHKRQSSDERLRIARELHDVIAHNISLINVQAGVALHLLDDDPGQAREALTVIKAASKETLQELRSTLGVLRRVDEEAPRTPAPSLTRLDELLGRLATSGLDVRLTVTGEPRELPANADLAAFRIVQEALTNVYRHAHVDTARVLVGYEPDAVTVEILDDGVGGGSTAGNGLTGMRERADALGGTLVAGPRPEGGFRVYGRLPA